MHASYFWKYHHHEATSLKRGSIRGKEWYFLNILVNLILMSLSKFFGFWSHCIFCYVSYFCVQVLVSLPFKMYKFNKWYSPMLDTVKNIPYLKRKICGPGKLSCNSCKVGGRLQTSKNHSHFGGENVTSAAEGIRFEHLRHVSFSDTLERGL